MSINLLIYGAGNAGTQIAKYFNSISGYSIVGFLDDNTHLHEKSINGYHVYSPSKIPDLIKDNQILEIFIAIPSASLIDYQNVLRKLSQYRVHLRTLPKIEYIKNCVISLEDIKEVNVEDVLLRPAIKPIDDLLIGNTKDKVVLVTGAGGTIGGELCRQILKLRCKKIILIDHSEFSLYSIYTELIGLKSSILNCNVEIVRVLGSVTNAIQMRKIVDIHRPNIIFHAAAYKHVGIVEDNKLASLENNVFGTFNIAMAACKFNVANFVLISTDKSVRPTSFMGVTKRISEMILQAFADSGYKKLFNHTTCFSLVRFGNVLGSSGSVTQVFSKQIKGGGPVTITHKDVQRFFMTISEAVELVLQSSTLAIGGDVFVLDMGDQIKIYDLAVKMIELSGKRVANDIHRAEDSIEIMETGLNPSEKMFEELSISNKFEKTIHKKIFKVVDHYLVWSELESKLDALFNLISSGNEEELDGLILKLVPEYRLRDESVH